MRYLIIVFMLVCSTGWAEQKESRTVYLSREELSRLNKGNSVYRWYGESKPYGEGAEFMDEVRPPSLEVTLDEYPDIFYQYPPQVLIDELRMDRTQKERWFKWRRLYEEYWWFGGGYEKMMEKNK